MSLSVAVLGISLAMVTCVCHCTPGSTHPSGVHHALWSACGAGGVHDEERVIEGKLLKGQLSIGIAMNEVLKQNAAGDQAKHNV